MRISFQEAIKLVHPDSNPDVTDAGTKVKTVKLYRDDPVKLHRLLTQWGLLIKKQQQLKRKFLDNLQPNSLYDGTVYVTHKKGIFKVMRTTTKRVYLDGCYSTGTVEPLKYCHIDSVINAFKVNEEK